MRGRATCGINRCELITQLHQRKLCHHSDKNLKIKFPPVPRLPIAFSFLPLKKVCSGVIGGFFYYFSWGAERKGGCYFCKYVLNPPEKLRAETSQAAARQHSLWLLLKHKVLHGWNKIYPAFLWLWWFPQGTKQGGLQAASSQGFSRHDFPAREREVGVIS